MSLTKPCERCGGSGRIPRVQRRLPSSVSGAQGELDPLDIVGKSMQLCDKCGGSGEQLLDPKTIPETARTRAADLG